MSPAYIVNAKQIKKSYTRYNKNKNSKIEPIIIHMWYSKIETEVICRINGKNNNGNIKKNKKYTPHHRLWCVTQEKSFFVSTNFIAKYSTPRLKRSTKAVFGINNTIINTTRLTPMERSTTLSWVYPLWCSLWYACFLWGVESDSLFL